jgi:hypothetical protein
VLIIWLVYGVKHYIKDMNIEHINHINSILINENFTASSSLVALVSLDGYS